VCVHDDSRWPLEWSGVVLSYKDKISRLEIDLVMVPSMALLQTLEVVCRPLVPELLKLLIQLPSRKSITFDMVLQKNISIIFSANLCLVDVQQFDDTS
jgi:hypothetical protein